MAVKRSELYSSLWASCEALRGGMDASQYKDYVLVLLFVKLSQQPLCRPAVRAHHHPPPGAGFADMVALKGTPGIGDAITKMSWGRSSKVTSSQA